MKISIYPIAALAAASLLLAGCTPTTASGPVQDPAAGITVWADSVRVVTAQNYADANPDANVTAVAVDDSQGALASRIALATNAGDELPDVVFLGQPDSIATLIANPVNFPLDVSADADFLDGFAEGTVARCSLNGAAYCVPNDIGQTVLYYNQTLFESFGYEVPTTFDEWLALGEAVAVDHPGFSLGSISGRYGLDGYYGSSGCQYNDAKSATDVVINLTSDACTRVNDVVGPLLANGTLSTLDPFDPAFTQIVTEGRLLATISPSWMGPYGIKPSSVEEGNWAVAPMPTWAGASTNYAGAVGGGIWVISAQSRNIAAAVAFVQYATTDTEVQIGGPTYPADVAGAEAWLASTTADTWYAADPAPALIDAAGKISPTLGFVRYQTQLIDSFNQTVIINGAADISSAFADFATRAVQAAEQAGYTVLEQ